MFGREFRKAKHRYHIPPPNPTIHSFEKVGSTKEALGLSGLSVGDEVYWYGGGDDVDTSASGVIVELPAVDPDGRVHSDMAAVEWSDDGYDIVEINNLLNAEHYNIGQGYSQALGSRKVAWNRASDLSDEELLNQFGNGPMDDDEFDVLIMEVERRGLMDQWESRMSSRKQASSLTWIYESPEQSLLGQEGWFANSGDGFHASIFEAGDYIQLVPGAQRFNVDIYTDSNNYEHVSVNESGFESVDEAKSFVEGVFGYSRVSSRTAGKCPKCDGMGRETYETDTGSLSTQTCKACGGTGQAKESRRKRASRRIASRKTADAWGQEYDGTWFGRFPNDVFGWLTPSRDSELPDTYTVSAEVDRPGDSRVLFTEFNVSLEEGKRMVEEAAAQVTSSRRSASRSSRKRGSRRTANDWEAIQDKVQLSGWDPMYADYIAWAIDNDKDVTDTYSIVDYSDLMGLDAEDEKLIKKFVNVTAPKLYSKRRTAFLDTVEFVEPRHRVAGWDWDDHLNGFIAAEAAREFTCACGANVPAPGYTDCRCGKRWNAYAISANGSKKMIAREIPVRENVVMARTASSRKTASPATMSDAEIDLEYQKIRRQIDKGDGTNFDRGLELRRELKRRGLPTNLKPPHIMRQEYGDKYDTYVISRKTAADYSNYSYDQLVDARDILRQEFADWKIDQSEYKDTLAEIEAEAESRGLTLASRKGRVAARRTASERDQVLEDWIAFLEKKGLPRNTGTWEPEASDFDSSGYSGEAMEFLYEWSSGKMGSRKIAAPSSGADAIAQHFPGWRVDDENGNFWEIHSPGGEHAFIHEEDGTYTVLTNDNTPDEFYETGLSFEDALAEVRAEGII